MRGGLDEVRVLNLQQREERRRRHKHKAPNDLDKSEKQAREKNSVSDDPATSLRCVLLSFAASFPSALLRTHLRVNLNVRQSESNICILEIIHERFQSFLE